MSVQAGVYYLMYSKLIAYHTSVYMCMCILGCVQCVSVHVHMYVVCIQSLK